MHFSGKRVPVYPSNRKDITEFTAKHFNEERIRKGLAGSPWKKWYWKGLFRNRLYLTSLTDRQLCLTRASCI